MPKLNAVLMVLLSAAVIAVLGVILALALPALQHTRAAGRRAASTANLGSLTRIMLVYCADYHDSYPSTRDGQLYQIGQDEKIAYPYWHIFVTWSAVLYDYIPHEEYTKVLISPGAERKRSAHLNWPSSYQWSASFAGDPALWSGNGRPDLHLQRPARVPDVLHPANKVQMWDTDLGFRSGDPRKDGLDISEPTPSAFGDGSVAEIVPSRASDPTPNPFENPVDNVRLHNTRDGVRGIDVPTR